MRRLQGIRIFIIVILTALGLVAPSRALEPFSESCAAITLHEPPSLVPRHQKLLLSRERPAATPQVKASPSASAPVGRFPFDGLAWLCSPHGAPGAVAPLVQGAYNLTAQVALAFRGHLDHFTGRASSAPPEETVSVNAYSVFLGPTFELADLGEVCLRGELSVGYRLLDHRGGLLAKADSVLSTGSSFSLGLEGKRLALWMGLNLFRAASAPGAASTPAFEDLDTSQAFCYLTYRFGR